MNPIEIKTKDITQYFMDFKKVYPKPYDKSKTAPFTKVRVILMNGTEFESQWFLHQFARHTDDVLIKQDLAIIRLQEQQQQKRISCLKPLNESILEETIGYEQLAIELTAILAQNEKNKVNKQALDFALLEDFDHLYRFANMLKIDYGIEADNLVGKYTEIMPGRPTIAEHRFPADNLRIHLVNKDADLYSKCVAGIITGAEQQTMNFYMNMAQMYKNHDGRKLFAEIAMVEEEHVTQYESLQDPNATWLENWVMHEFLESYLYYSMMNDESDEYIKTIWEEHFEMEIAHLKVAEKHLKRVQKIDFATLFPKQEYPKLLKFGENKEYIRKVLLSVGLTSKGENYVKACELPKDDIFFDYQSKIISKESDVPSHKIIEKSIKKLGKDYRYQDKPHPISQLQDRKSDNTKVGRG